LPAPLNPTTQPVPHPAKTIPPERDRLQSNLLVWTVSPILLVAAASNIASTLSNENATEGRYLLVALIISLTFALVTWLLKAATPAAAAIGAIICLLLTNRTTTWPPSLWSSGLPPLILLFTLTFAGTRFGRSRKDSRGLSEPRTGRSASQVIANLGVAALFAAFSHAQILLAAALSFTAAITALAEATADTVSSEIGQALGGSAFLITTRRRVPPGTDGAISLTGTLVGLIAAALVTMSALTFCPPKLFACASAVIFTSATAGFFFDSLLGATLERSGYINNDLVNFLSTACASAIFYPLARAVLALNHL
jgi:uncharacterized protein (TIGR00297 family)